MNKQQLVRPIGASAPDAFPRSGYSSIPGLVWLEIFILTIFFLEKVCSQQADHTTVAYASGRETTEAVIRRILRSQIFPEDYGFLLRMAYVESKFGTETIDKGGIWQVDQWKLENTQDLQNETLSPILQPFHERIQIHFNVSWMNVKWEDLLKPLYSGIAARLFLALKSILHGVPIPDTINRQADFWNLFYRFEDEYFQAAMFRQESRFLQEANKPCSAKLDLVIAFDGSSSIRPENFQTFARNIGTFLVQTFQEESLVHSRIGVFIFSTLMYYLFDLENDLGLNKMKSIIESATYPYGDTRTDKALRYGMKMFMNAKSAPSGVPQILLIFQEGQSGVPVSEAVSLVAANNVTTIIVGIGNGVNETELIEVGLGNRRNVFTLADFGSLPDFFSRLSSALCTIPQKPLSLGDLYSDALAAGELRFYVVDIPNKKGVTIFIKMEAGSVKAYWSHNDEVPSQVVHDGEIDGVTFIPPPELGNNSLLPLQRKEYNEKKSRESLQKAYVSIEGLETSNVYDVYILEGNQDNDHSGSLASSFKVQGTRTASACFSFYILKWLIYRLSHMF